MNNNVYWHNTKITIKDRERLKKHSGLCLWFTGLSGSGKSTLANEVEILLYEKGIHTYLLDGDNVRHGLNKDIGFSAADRKENIRRIGEVAKLFVDAGVVVLSAFISPYKEDREIIRQNLPEGKFIEIFVNCNIETCESRDPKGLYKKARENKVGDFTGITAPYEIPENPEILIDNSNGTDIKQNAKSIVKHIEEFFLYELSPNNENKEGIVWII